MESLRAIVGFIACVLAAGCLSGDATEITQGPVAGSSSASKAPEAKPGDATGSLSVTVTTVDLAPVADAEVAIFDTEFAAYTDAAGSAVFNGLDPGNYTVVAAKPGYRALQERGRLVDVLAGETTTVKLQLEPSQVISANNSYHETFPFTGHMACSIDFAPGPVNGYTTYCSRGITVAGVAVSDPNDNSVHYWDVDSLDIQGHILELRWSPGVPGTAAFMKIGTYTKHSCTTTPAGQACTPGGAVLEATGASPVYGVRVEGDKTNLTKEFGKDGTKYPVRTRTEVRADCDVGCTLPFTLVFQQKYEAAVSAFYGQEPAVGWKHFP